MVSLTTTVLLPGRRSVTTPDSVFRPIGVKFSLWSTPFTSTMIWAAIWLGVINAVVRPILVLLTLPITLISLGGFLLVVNAAMFGLVAVLLDDFHVSGFFAAVFGAIIVSVTAWLGSSFIGPSGRYELLVIKRD